MVGTGGEGGGRVSGEGSAFKRVETSPALRDAVNYQKAIVAFVLMEGWVGRCPFNEERERPVVEGTPQLLRQSEPTKLSKLS